MFEDKTLMITGGTGSFGKTVVNRFLKTGIKEIRIFSRDEKKQEDMRITLNNPKLSFHIGDVRDLDSLSSSMNDVDYLFHAAALKQVPSCEFYPMEAFKTNVIGAENVIKMGLQKSIKRMVFLSTDKAVYPINAMGLSKAMMEKLVQANARLINESDSILSATRYGNVMASRGSVIPLFIDQIKSGKSLTLTDPNMTRFLMSLEDSVDLVLHAFENSSQGDIFVQKSPACTMQDLAFALANIFNVNPDIKIIGTRHGEKLYESLLSREEMDRSVDESRYFRVPPDVRDLNYNKYFHEGEKSISEKEDYNSHNAQRLDISEVEEVLRNLDDVKEAINA